jgi:hypothetical protein
MSSRPHGICISAAYGWPGLESITSERLIRGPRWFIEAWHLQGSDERQRKIGTTGMAVCVAPRDRYVVAWALVDQGVRVGWKDSRKVPHVALMRHGSARHGRVAQVSGARVRKKWPRDLD